MKKEEKYIKEAIDESLNSVKAGGGPFGAVIVKDGEVIARAGNMVTSLPDPTAHAEVNAIREAAGKLGTHDLKGCDIYCSCEPCPMCLGAIYWARLDNVYYAGSSQDAADHGFDDSYIYKEMARPAVERSVNMKQLRPADYDKGFIEWDSKDDKAPY